MEDLGTLHDSYIRYPYPHARPALSVSAFFLQLSLIPPALNVLGQAAFFGLIMSQVCDPSHVELIR